MNQMQKQVEEFHQAFGVPVNQTPCELSDERRLLRAKLIMEEAEETMSTLGVYRNSKGVFCVDADGMDSVGTADGLADLLYVTFGACLEFGIDAQAVFDEVHRSNMSKAWHNDELVDMPKDCSEFEIKHPMYCVKRADGKIIKSPSYSPADIKSVLEKLKGK